MITPSGISAEIQDRVKTSARISREITLLEQDSLTQSYITQLAEAVPLNKTMLSGHYSLIKGQSKQWKSPFNNTNIQKVQNGFFLNEL